MTRRIAPLLAVLSLLVAACTASAPAATPRPSGAAVPGTTQAPAPPSGGDFTFAVESLGAAAFDPAVSLPTAYTMHQFVFDSLIGTDESGNYAADKSLAQSWTLSPDGLTYTFKIRDGVLFSNGDKLTSEDVAYSFSRLKEPWVTNSEALVMMKNIVDVQAPDPLTVVMKVKQPSVLWFSYLSQHDGIAHEIVPKKYIEKVGREEFNKNPIGSGPYKVEKYQPGLSLVLVPSTQNHWATGTPRWSRVTLSVVPEESTRKAMLLSGQADAAVISRSSIPEAKNAGKSVFQSDELATYFIFFNQWQRDLPTSNPKVRKALSMAIDRASICKNLMSGYCARAGGWISFPYSWDPAAAGFNSVNDENFNVDQAKALMKEAGYPDGFDLQIFSVGLPGLSEASDINEAVAGMWRAIGVKAKLTPIVYASWVRETWCPGTNKQQDMKTSSVWIYPQTNRYWSISHAAILFASDGACAITKDPGLDQLIAKAQAAKTQEEYVPVMTEFANRIKNENRVVQMFQNGTVVAADPKKFPTWRFAKIHDSLGLRWFAGSR